MDTPVNTIIHELINLNSGRDEICDGVGEMVQIFNGNKQWIAGGQGRKDYSMNWSASHGRRWISTICTHFNEEVGVRCPTLHFLCIQELLQSQLSYDAASMDRTEEDECDEDIPQSDHITPSNWGRGVLKGTWKANRVSESLAPYLHIKLHNPSYLQCMVSCLYCDKLYTVFGHHKNSPCWNNCLQSHTFVWIDKLQQWYDQKISLYTSEWELNHADL